MDVINAFDKISHYGLIFQLMRVDSYPPSKQSISLFHSFHVKVKTSTICPIRSSVPQFTSGSITFQSMFTLRKISPQLEIYPDNNVVI
ncbi:hypothetical protein TNCV_3229081 [Trichonephila clavipes]|nr:hypothetical protein TNCV_3229081 [Trichonephila clavipes]